MNFFDSFNKVLSALENYQVDYVLVGGYAVALYGIPRATNDIDIFVKPEEENFVKLRNALFEVFKDEAVNEIVLSDKEEFKVTRYGTPEGYVIDILVQLGELHNFYDIKINEVKIDNIKVKLADIDSLIKLKENTFRNIDKEDIYNLKLLKTNNAGT